MTNLTVRTRFAPSPTGFLHIGGLRTALYAYIFAKKNNGVFLLRIEDTDQARSVPGAVENLIKMLNTMGLTYTEGPDKKGPHGPYIQSQRLDLYKKNVDILLEKGAAYRCFCTKERLDEMRAAQTARKVAPMYDRTCAKLTAEQIDAYTKQKTPFVIRQKIPYEKKVEFDDLVRGKMQFDPRTLDDQVLLKSDGFPTYHLANVVDDHDMEITHVIRGEEWLPSAPKHILLYDAFGWIPPHFAHLPLLLNPDKSKLSKRQGDVAVEDYLTKGYLKPALLNFVALLGWNSGTEKEIFSMEELVEAFSLERIQKAGAVFNIEKLDWLNGLYMRNLTPKALGEEIAPFLTEKVDLTTPPMQEGLKVIQTRMKTLVDGAEMLKIFTVDIPQYDHALLLNEKMKVDAETLQKTMTAAIQTLEKHEDWTSEEALKQALEKTIQELGVKNGQMLWPVRVALSGQQFSPGVFELLKALGEKRSLERLNKSLGL